MSKAFEQMWFWNRWRRRRRELLRVEGLTIAAQNQGTTELSDITRQLRLRAAAAKRNSVWMLLMLILSIFIGLVFYLGVPFLRQALDSRETTLEATLSGLASREGKLNAERRALRERISAALAYAAEYVDYGTSSNLRGDLTAPDGSVLIRGADGTLLRLSQTGETATRVDTGTDSSLLGDLTARDGSVLIWGAKGTLLRLSQTGETATRVDTGTDSTLLGDLTAPDGSVLIRGNNGTLLRLSQTGETATRVDTGTDSDLWDDLTARDGSVLIRGENGTLLRLSQTGETATRVDTGTDSALWGDLTARDGSVLIRGGGPQLIGSFQRVPFFTPGTALDDSILLRISEDGETVSLIVTGSTNVISGLVTTESGDPLFYGDGGMVLRVGDQVQRRAVAEFGKIDALLLGNPDGTEPLGEPKPQQRADALMAAFLDGLQRHLQRLPEISDVRQDLVTIQTKRAVLRGIYAETSAELRRLRSFPYSVLQLEQSRETFRAFMAVCRGAATPVKPTADNTADPLTLACLEGWKAERASGLQSWWNTLADSVPPGILLLFLLATLGGLYRYNLRLAGFHHSRADALEMLAMGYSNTDLEQLVSLSDALAADKVEFGKGNTPSDQAVEIARAVMARK